jgi:prolycopene isomerase
MKREPLPVTDTLRADAVIIGAGLGGLSAAGHLAVEGRRVVVLEHHAVPGGYAHEFKRRGFRFEVALHAMDGVGPGGWMHQPLSDLGVFDRVEFEKLDPFYTTRFPDHEITAWAVLNEYLAELKRDFPEEAEGIDDLFAAIERVGHDMGRYTKDRRAGARPDPMEMMERYPDLAMAFASNWASFLDRFISDARLAAIVSTLWGYLGLPPSKVSAGLFALVILSYHLTGAWYPKGGSQAMSRAMADAIVERGGEVRYRNTVTRIEVDGDGAVAVETHRGLRVEAEVVVSNASPLDTVRLAGREHFDEAFVAGMESDVPALSNLIVYLGVERDLVAEGWDHHEYFLSESYDLEADYRAMVDGDFAHTGMVLAHYTALDPGCAPAGHSVLAMLSLAPWDYENVWGTGGDLAGYQQNEEYLRVKNEAADQLIARAEQLIPGLTDSVVVKEIGTPLTNYRYGLNPAGSIYGREQTVANMMNRRSPKTPVPNLFLTGAWVSGGGMSSAVSSGRSAARAAERFLGGR